MLLSFYFQKERPTWGICIPGTKRSLCGTSRRNNSIWIITQCDTTFSSLSNQKHPLQALSVCHSCWSQTGSGLFFCISPFTSRVKAIFIHRIRCASCIIPAELPEWPNYVMYRWKTWIWAKHLIGLKFLSSCHPVTRVWDLKRVCFHDCECYWYENFV